MALSGVHVACGYVGGKGVYETTHSLLGYVEWSETMAEGGTTNHVAPEQGDALGAPSFEIYTSMDIYVSIGTNPDATSSPRIYIQAQTTRNVFCAPGAKLAWVAA